VYKQITRTKRRCLEMVQDFKDGISKDYNVYGYNTYLDNGQGCGTVWFKNVPTARKALKKDGIKTGCDLVDCTKCACNYSYNSKEYNQFPEHLCTKAKEAYAESFE
jgi:hypothetical protein